MNKVFYFDTPLTTEHHSFVEVAKPVVTQLLRAYMRSKRGISVATEYRANCIYDMTSKESHSLRLLLESILLSIIANDVHEVLKHGAENGNELASTLSLMRGMPELCKTLLEGVESPEVMCSTIVRCANDMGYGEFIEFTDDEKVDAIMQRREPTYVKGSFKLLTPEILLEAVVSAHFIEGTTRVIANMERNVQMHHPNLIISRPLYEALSATHSRFVLAETFIDDDTVCGIDFELGEPKVGEPSKYWAELRSANPDDDDAPDVIARAHMFIPEDGKQMSDDFKGRAMESVFGGSVDTESETTLH